LTILPTFSLQKPAAASHGRLPGASQQKQCRYESTDRTGQDDPCLLGIWEWRSGHGGDGQMAAPARTAGYLVHATRVVASRCRARAMDTCTQLLGDGAKERRRVAVPRGNEETRGEER